MLLQLDNIHTFYGWSHILFGVSLTLDRGEVVCLLGRNGAGKTTTFRSIIGLTPPSSGAIRFKDQIISGQDAYLIARKGIGYVPSGGRLFGELTVLENLTVVARTGVGIARGQVWSLDRIFDLFPVLKDRQKQAANSLSGGQRQMVNIARTLMSNPELLILDEPSTGLSHLVVQRLGDLILQLRDHGLSILLAEQNAMFGMSLVERSYVLDKGEIRFAGTTKELRDNKELMHMYLAV
jgi:branched-chain amino acid transport system ATP-binding protein